MIETRTSVYDFHFHLVFVTKYRKSIFDTTEKQEELKTLLASFAERTASNPLKVLKQCRSRPFITVVST